MMELQINFQLMPVTANWETQEEIFNAGSDKRQYNRTDPFVSSDAVAQRHFLTLLNLRIG